MKFKADWRTYSTRYWIGFVIFIGMLLFMIIRPISAGKGFMFFEMFKGMLLRDFRLTSLFLGICLLGQLNGYYSTQKSIKLLEILEEKLTFYFFNGSKSEFHYSDLSSIKIIMDVYLGGIFEITLKSGEVKKIRNKIKDKEKALLEIQKKILEFQNQNKK